MLLISLLLLSVIAVAFGVNETCPVNTFEIDDRVCFCIQSLNDPGRLERVRKNQKVAAEECSRLTIGGLEWHLPKVDTVRKRKEIGRRLDEYIRPHDPHPTTRNAHDANDDDLDSAPWIWLGLRRHPNQPRKSVSDESVWYWTKDNTTMTLRNNLLDFWRTDQPKDEAKNEFCALAFVYLDEDDSKKLQFADTFCDEPADTKNDTIVDQPISLVALACTADMRASKEGESTASITDQWWFYLLCGLLLACPILVIVIVSVIYCTRKKKKDRRQKHGRSSRSKAKRKQRERTEEKSRSRSRSDDHSATGDEYSNQDAPAEPRSRSKAKVGYVPPPMFPERTQKTLSDDDNKTVYSNALMLSKKKQAMPKHG